MEDSTIYQFLAGKYIIPTSSHTQKAIVTFLVVVPHFVLSLAIDIPVVVGAIQLFNRIIKEFVFCLMDRFFQHIT